MLVSGVVGFGELEWSEWVGKLDKGCGCGSVRFGCEGWC